MPNLGQQLSKWWVQLPIIFVLVGLTYSNIFANQFVWDDISFILEWPEIRQFWLNLPELAAGAVPLDHTGLYRPLRSLYYGLAFWVGGTNPVGYHILGILVHLWGTTLAYGLTRQLQSQSVYLPAVVALLFGLHPIHVEAITWITPTFDIIGVLLAVSSISLYISYRQTHKRWYLLLAWILVSLAYYSNEITLVAGGIMASYDLLLNRQWSKLTWRRRLRATWPWWLVLAPALVYLAIRFYGLDIGARQDYLLGSKWVTFLVMSVAYVKQWGLLLWPYPLTVNHTLLPGINALFYHEYDRLKPPPIPQLLDLPVIISLMIIGVVGWLAYRYHKRHRLLVFLFVWHSLAVLPLMQLVPQSVIFGERYLYFASFGSIQFLVLLLAWLLQQFPLRLRGQTKLGLKFLMVGSLVTIYGYISYQRNFDWRDSQTLWQKTMDTGPVTTYSLNNLGKHYYEQGDIDKSLELLEQSYQLNPNELIAASNLGVLYNRLGRTEEAIKLHQHVYDLSPSYAANYEKYASALLRHGDNDQAYKWYEKYLAAFPESPVAHLKYAQAFHHTYLYSSAEQEYQEIISKFPTYYEAHYFLARLYLDMGLADQASEAIDQARALVPEMRYQPLELTPLETELKELRSNTSP